MTARLRFGDVDDAPAIAALLEPLVREGHINFAEVAPTAVQLGDRIAATQEHIPWIVAVDEAGAFLGYVFGRPMSPMPGERWTLEIGLGLTAAARGRGLGTRLYGAMLAILEGQGYRTVIALVTRPNEASERLHARHGFRQIGVVERAGFKHGRWHDVSWWQKHLGDAASPPGALRPPHELGELLEHY